MPAIESADIPTSRLSFPRLLAVNAFWFGNGAHWQPIFVALVPVGAGLVVAPSDKDLLIGQVTAAGGIFALGVPIVVGWLSDRTRTRWGRRRPWMVAGTALNIVGLGLIAVAPSALMLLLAYLVVQAANNTAGAAYSGVIPDIVPSSQRGNASGLLGVMNGCGTVAGVGVVVAALGRLGDSRAGVVWGYAAIAVILTATLAISCVGIDEPAHPHLSGSPPRRDRWMAAIRAVLGPFRDHDFRWTFVTRLLFQVGIFTIVPFIELYFEDIVRAGSQSGAQSSLWLLVVILAGVPTAAVGGAMSDRWRRRKVFIVVSGALQAAAVGTLMFGLIDSRALLYVLGAVYGVGYGTFYAVDWAIACDVLPSRGPDAGREMALWHVSLTLPQVIAPAVAGAALHLFNEPGHRVLGLTTGDHVGYRVVFGGAMVWFLLGSVLIRRLRQVH